MTADTTESFAHTLAGFPSGLKALKDCAVALRLAGEYLCEERILRRIGLGVESDVERLKGEVEELKKRFVGKPAHEMSVYQELKEVSKFGKMMETPNRALVEKCRRGDLGRNFWEKTWSLREAIGELKARVEGKTIPHDGADYLVGVQEKLQSSLETASVVYRFLGKITLSAVIVGVLAATLLFFTMGGEKEFTKEIEKQRAAVQTNTLAISRVDAEISRLKKRISGMPQEELSREDTIDVLYFNLQVHRLREEKGRMEMTVKLDEERLRQMEAKLDEMKRKSFLEKLLRQ